MTEENIIKDINRNILLDVIETVFNILNILIHIYYFIVLLEDAHIHTSY